MKPERKRNLRTQLECLLFTPRLSQYFDGQLSTGLTWRIKNHIAVCEACETTVNSFNSVTSLLNGAMKHQVSFRFDAALETRIAAVPSKTLKSATARRYLQSLLSGTSMRSASRRRVAAPIAVAVAGIAFTGLVVQHLVSPVRVPVSGPAVTPVSGPTTDPNLVETCVVQHRTADGADPMDDTSALVLTSRVDSLPVAPSQNHTLSDDDAAVLLDEEM
jgi:hypothetical protein